MKGSEKFNLNRAEVVKWGKNILMFSSPLIILALTQFQSTGEFDWRLILAAFVQAIIDLLKKFLSNNTKVQM